MNKPEFKISEIVYHLTDSNQEAGMISGVIQRPDDHFTYFVLFNGREHEFYGLELSREKTIF